MPAGAGALGRVPVTKGQRVEQRRIVAGVDGSQWSKAALAWAVRQAELTGAVVEAVTAWELPATSGLDPQLYLDYPAARPRPNFTARTTWPSCPAPPTCSRSQAPWTPPPRWPGTGSPATSPAALTG